jgi:hypothetical protein
MKTYNNDAQFKTAFVAEVAKHRKADMLVKGSYGKQNGDWHGCAVACSLRSLDILKGNKPKTEYNDHARFEREGLWPEWLARLEDTLFENLPTAGSQKWPERLAKAVPVGVDLTSVKWQFSAFLLKENINRVLSLDISDKLKGMVVDSIRGVLAVHTNAIQTGTRDRSAAESAAESAWSAAESAESAAESAARSAAWSAAWSAAESAAESARSAAHIRYANKLLQLLRAAKSANGEAK